MEQINELIVSLVGPNGKLNDIYINTEKKKNLTAVYQ